MPEVATLTMQDIADLALVKRPVVSVWRRRPKVRGELMPFPQAVSVIGRVEHFDRAEIVDWLAQTGRGNNIEQRLDAPALAVPAGADLEQLVSLLCLRILTGEELAQTTQQGRITLAAAVDSSDTFLLREIKTQQPTAGILTYIDDLMESSFGPPQALATLESGRLGRGAADRGLTPEAIEIVRAVAAACRDHINPGGTALAHAGAGSLTLAFAAESAEVVIAGDTDDDRRVRRRAIINELEVTQERITPSLRVASLVGMELPEALDRLDAVILELGVGDVAVVIGPASALCDGLSGKPETDRAETMRAGSLVVALRLPRGLWREAHRQNLGLWVCEGGRVRPHAWIADLTGFGPAELDLDDLSNDVAGALAATSARAFRYARRSELAPLLASGRIVPRGVRALRMATSDSAEHLDRITSAILTTIEPLPGFEVLAAPARSEIVLRQRSLAELRDRGHLKLRRGSRINADNADAAGTVSVLSADPQVAEFMLDAFDATRLYRSATRTEPGDVIFIEKPRPMARVDERGGSLVASPSRILRLRHSAGIGPHALAAVINGLVPEGTDWLAWSVPELESAEAFRLEAALIEANEYEAQARRRVNAARALKKALIEGIAAGVVTLDAKPTTRGITPRSFNEEEV